MAIGNVAIPTFPPALKLQQRAIVKTTKKGASTCDRVNHCRGDCHYRREYCYRSNNCRVSDLFFPLEEFWISILLYFRYFAAYFVVVMVLFAAAQNKVPICRCIYWVFNEYPRLHASKVTRLLSTCLVGLMTSMKRRPVVILVKSDEVCRSFSETKILGQSANKELSHSFSRSITLCIW